MWIENIIGWDSNPRPPAVRTGVLLTAPTEQFQMKGVHEVGIEQAHLCLHVFQVRGQAQVGTLDSRVNQCCRLNKGYLLGDFILTWVGWGNTLYPSKFCMLYIFQNPLPLSITYTKKPYPSNLQFRQIRPFLQPMADGGGQISTRRIAEHDRVLRR